MPSWRRPLPRLRMSRLAMTRHWRSVLLLVVVGLVAMQVVFILTSEAAAGATTPHEAAAGTRAQNKQLEGSRPDDASSTDIRGGGFAGYIRGSVRWVQHHVSKWMKRLDKWDGETRPPCVSDVRCSRLQRPVNGGGFTSRNIQKKKPTKTSADDADDDASFARRWRRRATRRQVLAFVNETTTFSCPSKPDLVILVVTSIPNVDHRLSIRETWASIKQLNNLEILTLFVMGRIADEKGPFKYKAMEESGRYNDVVQGDFVEHHRNQTLQVLLGLKWVQTQCGRTPAHILVTRDDTFVQIFNVASFLQSSFIRGLAASAPSLGSTSMTTTTINQTNNFFICLPNLNISVMRNSTGENSKWNVSPTEFSSDVYPTYCNSVGFFLPGPLGPTLLRTAQQSSYFFVYDVFITGILKQKLSLNLIHLGRKKVFGKLDVSTRMLQNIKTNDFLFATVTSISNSYPVWGQLIPEEMQVNQTIDYQTPVNSTEHPWNFTILEPDLCKPRGGQLFSPKLSFPYLVMVVFTSPENFERREILRSIWTEAQTLHLIGISFRFAFLVGLPTDSSIQQKLKRESETYHDIVQQNFVDSYRNLTFKTLMGLEFVTKHCDQAKYILKIDDDMFVNLFDLYKKLLLVTKWRFDKSFMFLCHLNRHVRVYRASSSKWRVTFRDFSRLHYPNYCDGPAYLLTIPVARAVFKESQSTRTFWIEDVFVTGIIPEKLKARGTDVRHINMEKEYVTHDHKREGAAMMLKKLQRGEKAIFAPIANDDAFYSLWKLVKAKRLPNGGQGFGGALWRSDAGQRNQKNNVTIKKT